MTRVLLVDDAEGFRKLMTIMLSRLTTVEVIGQAQNCMEARAAVRTLRPDVVILDLHMPDGSGLEVLRDMKREPNAPIAVMCTSDPDPTYRKRCLDEGADFFWRNSPTLTGGSGFLPRCCNTGFSLLPAAACGVAFS